MITYDTVLSPSTTVSTAGRGIRRIPRRCKITRVTTIVDAPDGNPVVFEIKRGTSIETLALVHAPGRLDVPANGGSKSHDVWDVVFEAGDYVSLGCSAAAAASPVANPCSICVELESIPFPGGDV